MTSAQSWWAFLVETAFVREYPVAYSLQGAMPVHNPVLESALPSLLYVKMAAVMDEALADYMEQARLAVASKYRDDLHGRISTLDDTGLLSNASALHDVRLRRNSIAHESIVSLDWDELDAAIDVVQECLSHLGMVKPRPTLVVNGERSKAVDSLDPDVMLEQDYAIRVMNGDKVALEYRWTEKLYETDRPS